MSAITLTDTVQCQNSTQMFNYGYSSSSSVCEIEEEDSSQPDETNHHGPMATINEEQEGEDSVYVAVGKSDTSMEALSWTLKNWVTPSTIVYLIHVFPEIKHVPSPCKLAIPIYLLLCFCFFLSSFLCFNIGG